MEKLAFSHPGKLGDALYALPTIRYLCNQLNKTCDFYTSEYCSPLIRLFEYQPYIDQVVIPSEYTVSRMDMGVQPWKMPIHGDKYSDVFHLGFRSVPDKPLHQFIALSAGVNVNLPIAYEYPPYDTPPGPYLALAPRGDTDFKDLFLDIMHESPWPVVTIGGSNESVGIPALDLTGLNMLETVSVLSKAIGFVGLMSSQLVLANGFNYPKVVPHDGKSWDMRHVVKGPLNHYLTNPSADDVLKVFGGFNTYSKTLQLEDYERMTEPQHVSNIVSMLHGVPCRFEHEHRAWEYGLILNALRANHTKTVLDVGGGGSVFAPAAVWLNMRVLQADPGNCGGWVSEQAQVLGRPLKYKQTDLFDYHTNRKFDAVTCISVLEHVPDDVKFFNKLLTYVADGGLIAITVDFHPTANKRIEGHLRTYNAEKLNEFISLARLRGFELFNGAVDYSYTSDMVNNYTFASLIMQKGRER